MDQDIFLKKDDCWLWIYYNPDSMSGGQYVVSLISERMIEAAAELSTPAEFFDKLHELANQRLIDKGTADFEVIMNVFQKVPDYAGCTEETMNQLIGSLTKEWLISIRFSNTLVDKLYRFTGNRDAVKDCFRKLIEQDVTIFSEKKKIAEPFDICDRIFANVTDGEHSIHYIATPFSNIEKIGGK